jgi:hypothetical protein
MPSRYYFSQNFCQADSVLCDLASMEYLGFLVVSGFSNISMDLAFIILLVLTAVL